MLGIQAGDQSAYSPKRYHPQLVHYIRLSVTEGAKQERLRDQNQLTCIHARCSRKWHPFRSNEPERCVATTEETVRNLLRCVFRNWRSRFGSPRSQWWQTVHSSNHEYLLKINLMGIHADSWSRCVSMEDAPSSSVLYSASSSWHYFSRLQRPRHRRMSLRVFSEGVTHSITILFRSSTLHRVNIGGMGEVKLQGWTAEGVCLRGTNVLAFWIMSIGWFIWTQRTQQPNP